MQSMVVLLDKLLAQRIKESRWFLREGNLDASKPSYQTVLMLEQISEVDFVPFYNIISKDR